MQVGRFVCSKTTTSTSNTDIQHITFTDIFSRYHIYHRWIGNGCTTIRIRYCNSISSSCSWAYTNIINIGSCIPSKSTIVAVLHLRDKVNRVSCTYTRFDRRYTYRWCWIYRNTDIGIRIACICDAMT